MGLTPINIPTLEGDNLATHAAYFLDGVNEGLPEAVDGC